MNQRGKINLIIFQTLIFSLLFALFGRLFYLQVLDSDRYQDAAISIQSRDIVTPAVRGAITDINGSPLVVDLPGLVLFADRATLDRQADKGVSILSRVATLFKLEYSDIYQRTRLCGELPRENRARTTMPRPAAIRPAQGSGRPEPRSPPALAQRQADRPARKTPT